MNTGKDKGGAAAELKRTRFKEKQRDEGSGGVNRYGLIPPPPPSQSLVNVVGALLALQDITPNASVGRMLLADEPLLISRLDVVIWHSVCKLQGDTELEEELMCQSEPVCCPGTRVHQSHKRTHWQDVVMVLGDSPGDGFTFCWMTARQRGPNRISWPGVSSTVW